MKSRLANPSTIAVRLLLLSTCSLLGLCTLSQLYRLSAMAVRMIDPSGVHTKRRANDYQDFMAVILVGYGEK
jgi:hypothetical protein